MSQRIDYDRVLNPRQLEAVMTLDGPVLVIAGAGSGKTRTLVFRVARLVEQGIHPENILLLTFTRKAAGEMMERAAGLSDDRCRQISGGTFHSLAHRVLRRHAGLLGFETNFTILDRADMEEVVQALVKELQPSRGSVRFPKRGTVASILSKAANLEQSIENLVEEDYAQFLEYIPQIQRLGSLYRSYKKKNQLMDYDDLILFLRQLLAENESLRHALGDEHRYIMVDEYQDTNAIQADIISWLAMGHGNIMVVGDDAQSIYSFRGANYRNMFEFPQLFQNTRLIKLEENYRSTQPILNFTNALMERAREKYSKCLYTKRGHGEIPRVVDTRTDPEQGMFICQSIEEQLREGGVLRDFAVLFRAAHHSFELELELTRRGIPYVKYGGFKFMESAHIKDLLAHLRVIVNKKDSISMGRILRLLKNIGPGKSQAIIDWMKSEDLSPQQIDQWPGAGRNDVALKNLANLLRLLNPKKTTPLKSVEAVRQYYEPILRERFDDFPRRAKDLEQLAIMAGRYEKLRGFLDDLMLEPPTSSVDITREDRGDCLTLSTVHSAKGLEWSAVYILWAMEGYFPSGRAYASEGGVEEERRLMYVAATRAKDRLFVCYPGGESRPSWSSPAFSGAAFGSGLSSFIRELPESVMDHTTSVRHGVRPETAFSTRPSRPAPATRRRRHPTGLMQGDRVRHPAFGAGVISRFLDQEKVEVLFRNAGRRLLHLEYTTLEKI